jgi:hypothetical protein
MECPASDPDDVVRLWWWNPGGGASSKRVLREDLDEIRQELRSMGATTWITGAFPLTMVDGGRDDHCNSC